MTNYDDIAWQSIHDRAPSLSNNKGAAVSGRSKDYEETTAAGQRKLTYWASFPRTSSPRPQPPSTHQQQSMSTL
jgi:hypothetical protein